MPDGNDLQQLYKVVSDEGLYTKSYDEFQKKYSDSSNIDKLYTTISQEGLYTKDKNSFYQKYYPNLGTPPNPQPLPQPAPKPIQKPTPSEISQQEPVDLRRQLLTANTTNLPDNTFQAKQRTIEKDAGVTKFDAGVKDAVTSTAKARLKAKGKAETPQTLSAEMKHTQEDLKAGKLAVNKSDNGEISIATPAGFWDGIAQNTVNTLHNLKYAPLVIAAHVSGDNKALADVADLMKSEKEYINNHPYQSLGSLFNSNPLDLTTKAISTKDEGEDKLSYNTSLGSLGQTVGGGITNLAPLLIPGVGEADAATNTLLQQLAGNAPRMIAGGAQTYLNIVPEKFLSNYQENITNGMPREEAAAKAAPDAEIQGILPSVVGGAFFSGEFGGGNAASKNFADALGHTFKNGTRFSAAMGVQAGADDFIKQMQGYKANYGEDISEAMKSGFLQTAAMELLPHALSLPKYLQSQLYNYATKNISQPAIETQLQSAPDGSRILKNVVDFKNITDQLSPYVNDEHLPVVAGLASKINSVKQDIENLEAQKKTIPEALHSAVDEKIGNLNDQIGELNNKISAAQKSDSPLDVERDDITGEKVTPESAPQIKQKTYEELSVKQREGIVVPKEYGNAEVIEKEAADGTKTYQPSATVARQEGGLTIQDELPVDKVSYEDKKQAQEAADKALAEHYYDNGLEDNLKPISENDTNANKEVADNTGDKSDERKPAEEARTATADVNQESGFEYRLNWPEISQKDREKGVADIQAGKDTAAARKVQQRIQDMYDSGTITVNRGRGNQAETHTFKTEDWFGNPLSKEELDAIPSITPLHEEIINREGITADNIDNFKNLFDGFPYDESDLAAVKEYLAKQSAGNDAVEPVSEQSPTSEGATAEAPTAAESKPSPQTQEPNSEQTGTAEPSTTGIAQRVREQRADVLGLTPAEIGTGWTKQEAFARGKDLIRSGVSPEDVLSDFNKDGKISDDTIAVVQARAQELALSTNQAGDKFGLSSPEYKESLAKEDDWLKATKPMQTVWSRAGVAQQGGVDIDTGTVTGLQRAFKAATGKDFTPKQTADAKELADKVSGLSKEVEDLKAKLSKVIEDNKGSSEKNKNYTEKAKTAADKFRKLKSKPFTFKDGKGNDIPVQIQGFGWNDLVELGAKVIEKSGEVADGVAAIVDKVKDTDWYKDLSQKDKDGFEDSLTNHFGAAQPIQERFVDKKDSKFSPEDASDIWGYAKSEYIDKGADFANMINGVGSDLGLTAKQVRDAITSPKGAKAISDEMYRKTYDRDNAIKDAQHWVDNENKGLVTKVAQAIPNLFFGLKVFGHGTVGMITHAGTNLFRPTQWKSYFKNFAKQFDFAYGGVTEAGKARYQQAMDDLKNDSDFSFWKRAGLAVDPAERYDDYQFFNKQFDKLGKAGKIIKGVFTLGDRGFNALKVYRLEQAKATYEQLSATEKADPNTAKEIAKIVNHATGTSKIPLPEAANTIFFAPRLEASRWAKIAQPIEAIKTLTNWRSATIAEKAKAKIVLKRNGELLGTYAAGLLVNQALLSVSGSKNNVNFTDPTKSDFLKFKVGEDKTIDATGGMLSTLQFIGSLAQAGLTPQRELHGKSRTDLISDKVWKYGSGKFSPFASTAKDVVSQRDYQGNVFPWSNDKPADGKTKLTWGEYFKLNQTPIPIAEGINEVNKSMQDKGIPEATANQIWMGILTGAVVGETGAKIGDNPKPSPYHSISNEDANKPAWKFLSDKGVDLPEQNQNTVKLNLPDGSKRKMTDDEFAKYFQYRNDFLEKKISELRQKNGTWSKTDTEGNVFKSVRFKDLNASQLKSVLKSFESKATEDAKAKLIKEKNIKK